MWTKKDVINKALAVLGVASYEYDISPEEYNSSLMSLDMMLATWNRKGLKIGYPLPGSPNNSELLESTYFPDDVVEAAVFNLAIAIAPEYGIDPSPIVSKKAKMTYDTLMIRASMPVEMIFPTTMPRGSGNKRIDDNYYNQENDYVNGPDSPPDFLP